MNLNPKQLLKKYPALIFVFTALFIVFCRCQPNLFVNHTDPIVLYDGTTIGSCEEFTEVEETDQNFDDLTQVWECTLTCPDGSEVNYDVYSRPPQGLNTEAEKEAYQAQYCSTSSSEEPAPTATPTPASDEAIVIPQQNLLILQPLLAGNVTVCDIGAGFINFPLSEPKHDLNGKNISVTINGKEATCQVAGSNSQLLGCTLPAGTTFPATIRASIDGVEVNNFTFDGGICTEPETQQNTGEDEAGVPTVEPTATPDCYLDPYNPACP